MNRNQNLHLLTIIGSLRLIEQITRHLPPAKKAHPVRIGGSNGRGATWRVVYCTEETLCAWLTYCKAGRMFTHPANAGEGISATVDPTAPTLTEREFANILLEYHWFAVGGERVA